MELLFVVDTTRLLVAAPLFLNKQSVASQPASQPASHEGEGESDNEHLCGALDPVTDQNVNRGDVRSKKHDCHNAPLLQGGYHHQND